MRLLLRGSPSSRLRGRGFSVWAVTFRPAGVRDGLASWQINEIGTCDGGAGEASGCASRTVAPATGSPSAWPQRLSHSCQPERRGDAPAEEEATARLQEGLAGGLAASPSRPRAELTFDPAVAPRSLGSTGMPGSRAPGALS